MESESESNIGFDVNCLNELISDWKETDQSLFRLYVGEALSFFPLISTDLETLNSTSVIKEIGSGIGLLSLLVADRGFRVISFEPESAGFSLMKRFQSAIDSSWSGEDQRVEWHDTKYSPPSVTSDQADFIFAVNVLEHVAEWRELVAEILDSEKTSAKLRLIFPNYTYPYEPHFHIPTLFNKRLTRRVMSKQIRNSSIADPISFWEDLSWPTGRQLSQYCQDKDYKCRFADEAFVGYLNRIKNDESFRERKGKFFTGIALVLLPVLTWFAGKLPKSYLPVIDVTITKN